jgi:type VII secretion protein EccB
MASRRDLIQGYQFAARRVVSAVVMRQTDPTEWPFRRLGGAGFGSIMVAIIVMAAVGIYGLIVPGGKTSWQAGNTVIVVKETGASYVYIKGELHPTLNFTSAVLLAGSSQITSTSSASLVGYKRGVELGIPGAPASLPKDADLVQPPWTLCTQQIPNSSGKPVSRTRLVVGRNPNGGADLGDRALLVTDMGTPAKQQNLGEWLIWRDHRYWLKDLNVDRVALQLDNVVNVPVGSAWLQTLSKGQDIEPMTVDGAGSPSHAVPNVSVTAGQVLAVQQDKGTVYYLAGADSLQPISRLQADVQMAGSGQSSPQSLSSGDAAAATKAQPPSTQVEQPPPSRPGFVDLTSSDTVLCSAYANGSTAPTVLVNSTIPGGGGLPTAAVTTSGTPLADRVWVPPGRAALVESLESPKADSGPMYLVTDEGIRYAIPSSDVLNTFALLPSHASKLPASLLSRIPEGPVLDPDTASAALALEQTDN